MKRTRALTNPARVRRTAACVAGLVALLSTGLVLPFDSAGAASTVPLGTADSFAVLAGSTITNTGQSVITGDVGLHPGTAVTGFGPGADAVTQDGSRYVADDVALQAKNDLTTAYTSAAGQTPVTEVPTELGGTILTAGVYDSASGTFGVTGPLTLDGQGDPGAVFVFQMGTTLTTASASTVNLINGASICNVFWQVGSSATLGTNSTFRGTILANMSISLTTGALIEGRVLAREGAVTMDTNTITNAACSAPADDDAPTETPTATPTPTPTPTDAPTVTATPAPTPTPTDAPTVPPVEATTPPGDGTTTQITRVPTGSVPTGGGDTEPGEAPWFLTGALMLLAVAGTIGFTATRRARA